jgi:hypothetical protein
MGKVRRWLAVYDQESIVAQLNNVAVVSARMPAAAKELARHAFRAGKYAEIDVFDLEKVPDGWAYFV